MLRLTATPTTQTQSGTPFVRLQLTTRSNLAVRGQREAGGLSVVEELPREVAMAAVRDAASLGYRELVIDGGEPLLHRSLGDVLARAERHSLRTTIVTNGTLLHQARRVPLLARYADRVAIVVHGTADTHDQQVERPGAFAQTIANLSLLRDADIAFDLRLAITAESADQLDEILQLAAREGAGAVDIHSSWDCGLDDDEIAARIHAARPLAEQLGIRLQSDLIDRDELMLFRGHYVPTPSQRHLATVVPTLVIEPSGRVRPIDGALPAHLMIGNLHASRLTALAPAWLRSDRPRTLIDACDRAWWTSVAPDAPRATRWTDELALHVDAPAARPLAPLTTIIAA